MMNRNECSKISALHLWYAIAIFLIILVLGILVIPHCVSKCAFENFSFAATITSIVLAVISIVYSYVASNESSMHLANISTIEGSIKEKLSLFDKLDESIKNSVRNGMLPIQESVSRVNESIGELTSKISMNAYSINDSRESETHGDNGAHFNSEKAPFVMLLALLACSYQKTCKKVPLSLFDFDSAFSKGYAFAILMGLSYENKQRLSVQLLDREYLQVDIYDETYWGTTKELKEKLESCYKSEKTESEKKVKKIIEYFEKQ